MVEKEVDELVKKEASKSAKTTLFENRDIGINSARWEKNGFKNYSVSHYNLRLRTWSNLRLDDNKDQIDATIEALEAIRDDM